MSMAGRGAWRDNVFVERLWRSVKYEEVYLRAYDSVTEARASLGRYLEFYNRRRPHSSLGALAWHGTPEIFNTDHGSQLGFNWPSQRPFGPTADGRQTLRQASSSQDSYGAWC